jgi:hypothetical protein
MENNHHLFSSSKRPFHSHINNNQSINLLKYSIVHCTPLTADVNPDGKGTQSIHSRGKTHKRIRNHISCKIYVGSYALFILRGKSSFYKGEY